MKHPNAPKPELDDVLQELVGRGERPDVSVLADLAKRYPDLAGELGDFAAEWYLQEALPAPEAPSAAAEARSLEAALRKFDGLLHGAVDEPAAVADPFAGRQPAELRELAEVLGLDKTVLAKLRDRKIEVATIPEELTLSLSRELNVPWTAVLSHLSGPAMIPCGASFKTHGKPTAGAKETFAVAIERSQLEEVGKARWLALAAGRN